MLQDVIGRGFILSLVQNEAMLPEKLASKEAGTGLPPVIPRRCARCRCASTR